MAKKLTQENIIKKFIQIHSYKYDYSRIVYLSIFEKVCIVCHIHGEFWQTPANHLKGKGCKKCKAEKLSKDRLSNIDEFKLKAFNIYNNRYEYNNFIYKDSQTKGHVTCSINNHGDFLISPNNHLRGRGCPICFGNDIITLEQFIEKARTIHGDKYNYNKVIYINNHTKVIIICPIHGEFEQTPSNHLSGKGCNDCGNIIIGNKLRSSKEDFIQKARLIHGDKNDYSKVNYINNWTKVCIACLINEHGEYWQIPSSHLSGSGCPKCNSSRGELTLEKIFKKHQIKYEPQYNIPEIIANYEIDFYLPEYRCLIEFHGIQHYEYVTHFHRNGEDDFLKQKDRDVAVRDAAIRWKYNYLEFNYKQLKYLSEEQFEELVMNKIIKFKRKEENVKIYSS